MKHKIIPRRFFKNCFIYCFGACFEFLQVYFFIPFWFLLVSFILSWLDISKMSTLKQGFFWILVFANFYDVSLQFCQFIFLFQVFLFFCYKLCDQKRNKS